MNLGSYVATAATANPSQVAVRLRDEQLTYGEINEATAKVAGVLRSRGVQEGDRVGLMLPNVPEFAVVYYGVLRAGGVVVPMNPLLKGREVAYYLQDSGARLLFAAAGCAVDAEAGAKDADVEVVVVEPVSFADVVLSSAQPLTEVSERADDDTAVILYTSGTTGHPKGAELTHANLALNAEVTVEMLGLTADDIVFGGLPLFHAFGQTCTLNAAFSIGATLTLLTRFDAAQALQLLTEHRATIFEGVPTMYSALLAEADSTPHDLSALRACVSGGAALPVEVLRGFEEAFGAAVLEGYGLSETSPVACFNHLDRPRKAGTIGTPVRGVAMRVVEDGREVQQGEVGEIEIRGHNIMKGYWNRPDATAEAIVDGWFRSGDLGKVDEDGYFSIVGRKKELIIRGGYNVYPREIEEVLHEHPAVAECAVVGIPHATLGEEVGAAVALKPGAAVKPQELRSWVRTEVAAYKYPRHVWIVDALPKNATGKIQKRDIVPPPGLVDR